jgi:hypothetical protein
MAVRAPVANNCGVKANGENHMIEGGCAGWLPYCTKAAMISEKTTTVSIPVRIN